MLIFSLSPVTAFGQDFDYIVKKDDSLWTISRMFEIDLASLIRVNPQIKNPDLIYPGQKIIVPAPVPTPQPQVITEGLHTFEKEVIDLVNAERTQSGLKPLIPDLKLIEVAKAKAQDISNNNYFSSIEMLKSFGVEYRYAGENIAKGQITPQEVMDSWMNSEGHRNNILSHNFTNIGVGFYQNSWVQVFTKP